MFQWPVGLLFLSRLQLLFLNIKFQNAFTCTLANDYPLSDEISDKNGPVRGDCIACDALFRLNAMLQPAGLWGCATSQLSQMYFFTG